MAHIDYFFTPLSPFAYLAGDGLETIAAKHGATIAYKPANYGRLMEVTGGLPVGKRHPSRQAYRLQELPRIAKRNGLKINVHPAHWPTDGTLACAAIAAVQAAGGDAGAVARALMAACWAEEKDIADAAVVDACVAAAGAAVDSFDIDAAKALVEANTDEGIEAGVFGAPFYIVDGEQKFWGQDRLPYLDEHLAGAL
ncbi:MAG: DsbA family protein [Pseudomonadota bacterium]